MRTSSLVLLGWVLASASLALGQSKSITITASRTLYIAPDQIVFSAAVTTPVSTSLDEVVSSLSTLGITPTNLQVVQSVNGAPMFTWTFQLSVPFATLGGTIDSFASFQKTNSALQFSFSLNGTHVSAKALAAQPCPYPDLIADAQIQAHGIAATTGSTVGPILALSHGAYQPVTTGIIAIREPAFLLGTSPLPQPVPCSIAVKFQLK